MELTILGSWAGSPGAHSACSSYLVSAGDTKILLDCGPGLVPVLQERHDPERLSGIFISHMHADHTLDLLSYAYRLIRFTWRGIDIEQVNRIPLYLPPGGIRVLDAVSLAYGRPGSGRLANPFTTAFIPVELEQDQVISLGDLTVIPYPVVHSVPAFGYRVESSDARLAYTGDTKLCPELFNLADGVDILLCEATAREEGVLTERAGHLTARQAGRVAARAKAKRLVLTHLTRQDEEWISGLIQDAQEAFNGGVQVAATGLVVSTSESSKCVASSLVPLQDGGLLPNTFLNPTINKI